MLYCDVDFGVVVITVMVQLVNNICNWCGCVSVCTPLVLLFLVFGCVTAWGSFWCGFLLLFLATVFLIFSGVLLFCFSVQLALAFYVYCPLALLRDTVWIYANVGGLMLQLVIVFWVLLIWLTHLKHRLDDICFLFFFHSLIV